LKELSKKKKKRGEDIDENDLLEAQKKAKEEAQSSDDGDASVSVLPKYVKFPTSDDDFYPAEFDKTIFDCYNLRVVFDREKTGFEETKDFPIVINSIIGGRYQVVEYLGSAAFSKAIQCYDIHTEQMVCMKIIENNKDYFD
jgi:serine/threonine protein kinase